MNEKQEVRYCARMAVAQLFRSFLHQDDKRAQLMERLCVETMPAIIPALGDTLASHVWEAATRHFADGEEYVVVPVCLGAPEPEDMRLCVLIASTHDAWTFWKLDMNELHGNAQMAQIVEALDPEKKWDVEELYSPRQKELKRLVASV